MIYPGQCFMCCAFNKNTYYAILYSPSPLVSYEPVFMLYQLLKVGYGSCYVMNTCVLPPSNLYAEVLISNLIILEDGDFRRWLGHWGWAFRNQFLALMKETWELHSFHHVRSQQKVQMSIDLSTCYRFHL